MLVAPQQQLQSVVGLRQFAFTFGNIGTGAFDDPAGLLQRQDIGAAGRGRSAGSSFDWPCRR